MISECPACGNEVALSDKSCLVCGSSEIGFQNVRAARLPSEVDALAVRFGEAQISISARNVTNEASQFAKIVHESKAVMARSLGALAAWVNGDSPLYKTFHHQITEGRAPEDNKYDKTRAATEAMIHPFWFQEISYAALTSNELGLDYYGAYSVLLRTSTIEKRATVFEENPYVFFKRHSVSIGEQMPFGYRADWENRPVLAMAKLHSKLKKGMDSKNFGEVLIDSSSKTGEADCIEVNIYGPIHHKCIESVSGPKPKRRPDQILWKQINRKLVTLGATVAET
jgi:hypothetical protein